MRIPSYLDRTVVIKNGQKQAMLDVDKGEHLATASESGNLASQYGDFSKIKQKPKLKNL